MRRRIVPIVVAIALALAAIAAYAGASSPWRFSYGALQLSASALDVRNLHVTQAGFPVLDAAHIRVEYSLRDLLPGSTHRFGLHSIEADGATVTLVRLADGSYSLPLHGGSPQLPLPTQFPNRVPVAFTVRIRNGSVAMRAPSALDPQARAWDLRSINAGATIDSLGRSHYTVNGAFAGKTPMPFHMAGTVDVRRGYGMHHITAAAIPVRPITDFFVNTTAFHVNSGAARGIDLRIFALGNDAYHLSGKASIDDASIHVIGLAAPIEHLSGNVDYVDDEVFFTHIRGTAGGLPLEANGGVYSFDDPKFTVGVQSHGNLSSLRTLFAFARDQDISGPVGMNIAIDGPVGSPVILVSVDGAATYRGIAFDRLHARVAYYNSTVNLLPIVARSHGVAVTIRGAMEIGDTLRTRAAVHFEAPADTLPYAGEFLGSEPVVGDALLDGTDNAFYGYGTLTGRSGPSRVAALIHASPDGVLDVAPLEIATERGSLAGGYHLDRKTNHSAFWLDARNVTLRTPAQPSFLGVTLPAIPPIDGHVDRLQMLGGGPSGNGALLAGSVDAHDITISNVPFDRLHAQLGGTLANAVIDPAIASGPWGSMTGSGSLSFGGAIAVRGHYQGTLQGLRGFLGGVDASGGVSGTAAVSLANGRIVVQAQNLALQDARVRGIPVSSASGTVALDNGDVQVKNARASFAGGSIVAAGSYSHGISIVATGLDAGKLQGIGLPMQAGRLDADGIVRSGAPLPQFSGGVALTGGRVEDFAVGGSGLVDFHGDGAQLAHVIGGVDGMYAIAHGTLAALSSGSPQYDVQASVPAADVTKAIATVDLAGHHSTGTFNARLHIAGAGLFPTVSGPIGVPAGSINGLPFVDGNALISATRTAVSARNGSITVGSTAVQFSAAEDSYASALHLVASRADLADFNNFFDTGDTLAGSGSARFDVISQAHRLSTNGNVHIAGFRYRNLPIGNTDAQWSSAHNVLAGSLDITGDQGALKSHGSIAIAFEPDLFDTLRDSRYDLTGSLSNVDLSTWVAALGYPQVAINGRVDANATMNGRYPQLGFNANAGLRNGTIYRFPIDSAELTLSSSGNRILLDSASVTAPGVYARANGSMGFGTNDRVALSVYASSNDVPLLVQQLYRMQVPVTGEFESTLTIGGTISRPTFDAAFDASNATFRGVAIPLAFGSLQLRGHDVILQNAGLQLEHGTIAIEGSLPFTLEPFAVGPPRSPISFSLAVNNVDPGAFDALLGNATKLGGTIDGTVGIAGTVAAPTIAGRFSVSKGSYVSDFDRTPVTALNASLTFDRTEGTIQSLSAKIGAGTLTGSGNATFATGAFALKAVAKNAQIDTPVYGSGAVDANIALSRKAGDPNALLAGTATLQNATIPFAAFLAATQSTGTGPTFSWPVAFDFTIEAGKNVRVRGSGYGAGLDIGATGSLKMTGDLASPVLDGRFSATSGTLTYFDRAFRVQQAHVDFDPASGIIPRLYATGTTRISNPDPNTALNPYGSTDVNVAVTGPINALKVEFTSNPPGYSNEQILAMIAPFGGLINGISYAPTLNTATGVAIPNAAPIPGAQPIGGTSNGITVGQEAFNIANAQFSAGLLSPLEGAISQGLGLQNVNLTLDYYGNVGLSATRLLGKTVSIIYNQTFGIPERTSVGFALIGAHSTSAQVTFFFETGPQQLYQILSSSSYANRAEIGQPLTGQSGFAFTLQRHFW